MLIGSSASLLTVSTPPATVDVTAALATAGNASTATVAAPASMPARVLEPCNCRATADPPGGFGFVAEDAPAPALIPGSCRRAPGGEPARARSASERPRA